MVKVIKKMNEIQNDMSFETLSIQVEMLLYDVFAKEFILSLRIIVALLQ